MSHHTLKVRMTISEVYFDKPTRRTYVSGAILVTIFDEARFNKLFVARRFLLHGCGLVLHIMAVPAL